MPVPEEMERKGDLSFEMEKPFHKNDGGGGPYEGRFKKKKRSFNQKLKKFGRQGKFAGGFQMDPETYSYFVRIFELLREDDFETDEERGE